MSELLMQDCNGEIVSAFGTCQVVVSFCESRLEIGIDDQYGLKHNLVFEKGIIREKFPRITNVVRGVSYPYSFESPEYDVPDKATLEIARVAVNGFIALNKTCGFALN